MKVSGKNKILKISSIILLLVYGIVSWVSSNRIMQSKELANSGLSIENGHTAIVIKSISVSWLIGSFLMGLVIVYLILRWLFLRFIDQGESKKAFSNIFFLNTNFKLVFLIAINLFNISALLKPYVILLITILLALLLNLYVFRNLNTAKKWFAVIPFALSYVI
ncbi:hypothetical protein RA086_00480 [Lactiplantibacillus sp. WILCCON 0030]|uniref:Uncharacterized protein n=1 Tax=Lactiplantibacillus brownii TaxID=3069269 RepID=A0ABU1A571_9LACO|nr:hypothetical protein [Lactiplantibacillus brownii]MDQ7936124.1 hypothetical protein [Lactiplantibacillus brownii]